MIGKTVRFTNYAGVEMTGVVRDDKNDGRLAWSSAGRYLVVAPTELGGEVAYWVDDVEEVLDTDAPRSPVPSNGDGPIPTPPVDTNGPLAPT